MPSRCVTAGSSPRGRGKHRAEATKRRERGLIPARAGKTPLAHPADGSQEAHPRAGGENWENVVKPLWEGGSSPRGRGKRPPIRAVGKSGGLIPARAGKTLWETLPNGGRRAHPRAGGENDADDIARQDVRGSSPRGRGKQAVEGEALVGERLIPARAGKTTLSTPTALRSTAHPRAGGENPVGRRVGRA